jgi:crotonobetainyl-CoA:carnitine CoA-transferase CaiB-like acyl-CoA transferase
MDGGVFEGVKVLDISQDIAGSFCARLLADYGADVIKVEPSSGSALRQMGPFFKDDPHPEKSLLFLITNLNKRGITLNIDSSEGAGLFRKLAEGADVVVESCKPGYLSGLGLGYEDLERVNPGLIMTSITHFGQYGPYSQYEGEEIVDYAMGAIMSISGTSDREPLKHGGFQAQYEAGLNAAGATAVALLVQTNLGVGQHVDVSTVECVSSTMIGNQSMYSFTGGIQPRRKPLGTQFGQPMPCADGWVLNQAGGGATWNDIADFYEQPILKEQRFSNQTLRNENGEELDALLVDAIKDKGKWDLFEKASRMRMLFGLVQTPEELARCPQLESRGFYRDIEHPVMGALKVPAVLFNLSLTPYSLGCSAPTLGQHNTDVYCSEMGTSEEELTRWRRSGAI